MKADAKYMLERSQATIVIHQWSRFLWYWSVQAYIPNVAAPFNDCGITYTLRGARKRVHRLLTGDKK